MKRRTFIKKIYISSLCAITLGVVMPILASSWSQEAIDRKYELINQGYPGGVVVDQLYEEFYHVNGPAGTGGIDGLLLDGTPASGSSSSQTQSSTPNTTETPSTITPTTPIIKHTHSWSSEVIKDSTCIEKGELLYTCNGCNETYTESIPLSEHEWEPTEIINSTCISFGKTVFTCVFCNETMTVEQEELTEHIYIKTNNSYEATCDMDGLYIYKCNICGDTYEEVISAQGHTWNDEYTTDKNATCTTEGIKSIHCNRCDIIKDNSETSIACFGHTEDENHTIVEPTFTTIGTETIKCKTCGSVLETITLPATGMISDIVFTVVITLLCVSVIIGLIVFIKKKTADKHPLKV